jgi:hypothetical protein
MSTNSTTRIYKVEDKFFVVSTLPIENEGVSVTIDYDIRRDGKTIASQPIAQYSGLKAPVGVTRADQALVCDAESLLASLASSGVSDEQLKELKSKMQ